MLIVIFGASGKVGRLAVAEALRRGHHVRAFVHSHTNLPANPLLHLVRGDIHKPQDVQRAVAGCQAVLSTLGSWGTASKDIVTTGTKHIIPAMHQAGVSRIVTVTGADAHDDVDDKPHLLNRLSHTLIGLVAGKVLRDGENHIRSLRRSELDWTVLRSPVMTNGPGIFYKLSMQPLKPWQTIPRKAVAKALLDQIDGPGYTQSAPFIHR